MLHRALIAVAILASPVSLTAAAIEHAALPVVWQVKLDPNDVGVQEEWFDANHDDAQWTPLGTHDWEGWRKQGLAGDADVAWYRVRHEVPKSILAMKHVYLYFTCVDEQAWIWLNGQSAGEHTWASEGLEDPQHEARPRFWITPFALDVRKLLRAEGPNQLAVRVLRGGAAGGGIWKPVYIFASDEPIALKEMNDHAEGLNGDALNAKEPTVRYDVWTTDPYDPVYPDTAPAGDVRIDVSGTGRSHARGLVEVIRVAGACGEYVPVALHVRNRGDTALPIRLDFAGVRHEALGWGKGKSEKLMLRADRVQVHEVDYVLTRLKKRVPDPLPRAGGANGLNLGPGETGTYFVLIDTSGMPAGLWKGRAAFTPRLSGPKLAIPFELWIAPVVLPERVPIWVTFWTYPPQHGWMGEGRGPNKPYMELMRRSGSNVVHMSYRDGGPLPLLDENNAIVGIKVDEFDRMMLRRGFTHHDYLVVGLTIHGGTDRWGPHFLKDGHDQWRHNFVAYMRMLARHIRENYGLAHDRWGLYMNDEHIGDQFVPLGKLVREADPDIRIWANRIEDLETIRLAEPYIDVIVPYSPWLSSRGLGHGRYPKAEAFFLETGKPWWAYRHAFWRTPERTAFPRADPDAPHGMMRSRPWLAWKLGLQGYGYWVFAAPKWWGRYDGFPDVAPKGPFTNTGLIYLGHDGPVTSRRLEAYRDGWEDYKLLWVVKQAAALEGQDADLARQARAHLDTSVEQVLAGADAGALSRMRDTLLDHAARLGAVDPVRAMITGVETTGHGATVRLSSAQPIRVWAWLNRGPNHRRFIDASRPTHTPVVTIDDLVPDEQCDLTLVVGGPQGQQTVLQHAFVTKGW